MALCSGLSQNMRLGRSSEDVAYANWLSRMPYDQNLHGSIKLPDYINQVNSIDDLLESIFPQDLFLSGLADPVQYFSERAVLAIKNERVKDLNDMLLERLPGECTIFESINEVDDGLNGATDN
ncbi:uncharacterized protein J8A68_001694, partial [[Candida] subhashii]